MLPVNGPSSCVSGPSSQGRRLCRLGRPPKRRPARRQKRPPVAGADVRLSAAYDWRRILYNAAAKCPDLLAIGARSRPVSPSPCGHRPCPETTKTRRCRRQLQSCRQMEGGTQGPDCQERGATSGFRPGDRVQGVPPIAICPTNLNSTFRLRQSGTDETSLASNLVTDLVTGHTCKRPSPNGKGPLTCDDVGSGGRI